MGYRRATYRLRWPDGHELHGLEVTTRGLSIGDLRTVSGLAPTAAAGETSNIENIEPLLVIFAKSLVSWNYEDEDGSPVGTSLEELQGQDMRMLMPVVMTWIGEVSTIPDPLPKPSTDGETTEPVGSIPMEILPTSP